jgi:hypothetical protein
MATAQARDAGTGETAEIVFTEFVDPGGVATYFRTAAPVEAVEDELVGQVPAISLDTAAVGDTSAAAGR